LIENKEKMHSMNFVCAREARLERILYKDQTANFRF